MDLLLINALPFLLSAILAIDSRYKLIPKNMQTWFTSAFMLALFISFAGYYQFVGNDEIVTRQIEWMPELGLNFSYYLDGLALLFALIVTGVGTVIFWYSGYYFDDHETQSRFNAPLMAFTGAMIGLVISGNLILMFIMWELTSIMSFLLIGFKGSKDEGARFGASQALVITGGGGLALLAGVLLLSAVAGQASGAENLVIDAELTSILALESLTDHAWFPAIAILMMLGAFTKSAQFPFHFWLPGGMSAPTPASAFLHSATMVKAGVYLLARLYPIMHDDDIWLYGLMGVGAATMVIASFFSIKQRDLKGLLAYTTVTQLGMLVMLLGMPDFIGIKAAMVGILAHALYKAALFLMVGSIDHAFGTRNIDELGHVYKYMSGTSVIAIISAISMAGIPFFFGFVAKEVAIAAAMDVTTYTLVTGAVFVSAIFTATASFIFIWDVFFKAPSHELHFHSMPLPINAAPSVLAFGSLSFGFLLNPLIIPLIDPAIAKDFKLELFPGFITEFWISMAAIVLGAALFSIRQTWLPYFRDLPFSGTSAYKLTIGGVNAFGDLLLKSQGGKLRYYLASILGTLAVIFLASGLLVDLTRSADVFPNEFDPVGSDVLDVLLLSLAIVAALSSVLVKRHLYAVIALGVMGYAVAGVFLVEQAPDVALVQFVVETLSTVLVIFILRNTSQELRDKVMDTLWVGVHDTSWGVWRDAGIAATIGAGVFIFTLIALTNRPDRETIAAWHVVNAEPELGVTDIVAGILTDFRGMDTLIEIGVFAIAALGIWALFSINQDSAPKPNQARSLVTPLVEQTAIFALPLIFLIALNHIAYGSKAPGDGFTAGVIASLGVGLWYFVLGYRQTYDRLTWWQPQRFLSVGLLLGLLNAFGPVLGNENFMGLAKIEDFEPAGIKLSTTLVFEIAIALTVFGSGGLMLETLWTLGNPSDDSEVNEEA